MTTRTKGMLACVAMGLLGVGSVVAVERAWYFTSDRGFRAAHAEELGQVYESHYFQPRYTDGEGTAHYLSYGEINPKTGNGFIEGTENFTLKWENSSTQFKIANSEGEWLHVTALKGNIETVAYADATVWTVSEKGLSPTDLDGYLYWNSSSPRGLVYADKSGNSGYPVIEFYVDDEYTNNNWVCNWSEFQRSCLENLIISRHSGGGESSESSSSQPSSSESSSSSTSSETSSTTSAESNIITISPSDGSAVDGGSAGAAWSIAKEGVTIEGVGTLTSTQARVFKSKTMTISGPTMTSIVITCTANGTTKQGPGCWGSGAPEGYTFEASGKTGTWEGEADSVSFTASDNQVRITSIIITLK